MESLHESLSMINLLLSIIQNKITLFFLGIAVPLIFVDYIHIMLLLDQVQDHLIHMPES
jgi:hypothetical protein